MLDRRQDTKDFSTGTYVGCRPDVGSLYLLQGWMQAMGIPKPVPLEDLHVTTLYSHVPVEVESVKERIFMALTDGYQIMRHRADKTDALVMLLWSPDLHARHKELIAAGGVHDYPDFIPHMTLTYDVGDWNWKNLPPAHLKLFFRDEYIRPLRAAAD